MDRKNVVLLAIAVVILATAGVILTRYLRASAGESADFPEGTLWVCQERKCANEFSLSLDELGEFYDEHADAPVPCPECDGTKTARALRCSHCGHLFARPARGTTAIVCTHCKKEQPPATAADG